MRRASAATRALLFAVLGLALFASSGVGAVRLAASMGTPRALHTATVVPAADGSTAAVIVTGGIDATGATLATAERYDVAAGTWTPLAQTMAQARRGHSAVLLPTSPAHTQGGIFVVGGVDAGNAPLTTAEILDFATGRWATVGQFQLTPARTGESVTLVGDRVVIAGGVQDVRGVRTVLSTVQTFDTATNQVITTPAMATPRSQHAATRLADGRILVSGGFGSGGTGSAALASTEILNATQNGWTPAAPLGSARAEHTATLADGARVLITGGAPTEGAAPLATSERFDPGTGAWAPAGSMAVARRGHQATLVRDGWVAITGGTNAASPGGSDSADNWTTTFGWGGPFGLPAPESIGGGRSLHAAAAIPQTDEVLITGGGTPATASAVLYTPEKPGPAVPPATAPLAPLGAPTPPSGPVPVQSVRLAAAPVSGQVFVRVGTGSDYRELKAGEGIPVGTVLDTTDGQVRLTAAVGSDFQSAVFYGGTFRVTQPKGEGGLVELRLVGKPVCKTKASAAVKRKAKPRLWGDGQGKFRTRGANSSATVRGTKWLVEERCTGTFTRVARGIVSVRDFGRHKTLLVKAPRSYLARNR